MKFSLSILVSVMVLEALIFGVVLIFACALCHTRGLAEGMETGKQEERTRLARERERIKYGCNLPVKP